MFFSIYRAHLFLLLISFLCYELRSKRSDGNVVSSCRSYLADPKNEVICSMSILQLCKYTDFVGHAVRDSFPRTVVESHY